MLTYKAYDVLSSVFNYDMVAVIP